MNTSEMHPVAYAAMTGCLFAQQGLTGAFDDIADYSIRILPKPGFTDRGQIATVQVRIPTQLTNPQIIEAVLELVKIKRPHNQIDRKKTHTTFSFDVKVEPQVIESTDAAGEAVTVIRETTSVISNRDYRKLCREPFMRRRRRLA